MNYYGLENFNDSVIRQELRGGYTKKTKTSTMTFEPVVVPNNKIDGKSTVTVQNGPVKNTVSGPDTIAEGNPVTNDGYYNRAGK